MKKMLLLKNLWVEQLLMNGLMLKRVLVWAWTTICLIMRNVDEECVLMKSLMDRILCC